MNRLGVLLWAVTLLIAGSATARLLGQKADAPHPRVDTLFSQFNNAASPGAAVVVVKDGRVVLKRAYGQANLEYALPITSTTPFHIGSVSKQFTAYAVLLLEQEGRLSLDDDVRKYIREVPDFRTPITLRHLLHHLSGLRDRESLLQMAGVTPADTFDTRQILRLLARQTALNFKPGEQLEYCNTGYTLVAEVVARVAGKSFRAWTTEHVFRPLGMVHTWFADDPVELVTQAAYPYFKVGERPEYVKGLLNHSMVGDTGVVTTAEDMVLWLRHLESPDPGHAALVGQLLGVSGTLNNGEKTGYGFGFGITSHRGMKVAVHSGMDAGFRASVTVFLEETLGIAILGNALSLKPLEQAYQIADVILGLKPEPAISEPAEAADEDRAAASIALDLTVIRSYQGRYFSEELETLYTVVEDGGKLLVKHWRNDDVILSPLTKDTFTGDQSWIREMTFLRDAAGTITAFQLDASRARNLVFKKR